jgi:S-adenosylmethionine-diacylgycerolhomoserine-N-methlytransferase
VNVRRVERYTYAAKWYDLLSVEPVYSPGRMVAIEAMGLQPGDRVMDLGCGTGLNFAPLMAAIGPTGRIVGLDRSQPMLDVARRKARQWPRGRVRLVRKNAEKLADAHRGAGLRVELLGADGFAEPVRPADPARPFDAVLFTYSLSLMSNWAEAWRGALSLVRDGGRVGVVDMATPDGRARALTPLARFACWAGGSDIEAHPWTALETDAHDVRGWSLRGGHVQVRVGRIRR